MKRKIRWYEIVGGIVIYVILLGSSLYLLDRLVMPKIVRKGSIGEVPDIRGKTLKEAQAILESQGFRVSVAGTVSSEAPQNTVVSTDPSPGRIVKRGRDVKILLSNGIGSRERDSTPKEEGRPPLPNLP